MTEIGRFNELTILRLEPRGAVLDGAGLGELLLPAGDLPPAVRAGQVVKVFVYLGLEDRPVATRAIPAAQVGEVAYLKIVAVNDAGAFLAWGLPKDLLLPWAELKFEQKKMAVEGRRILVCVFQAEDGRIAASARLDDFLKDSAEGYREGDPVHLRVAEPTDLGLRVIVDHRYWGLVHKSDLFRTLARGQQVTGYVKALRGDGKLNLALAPPGYAKVDAVAGAILAELKRSGGFLAVTDKTAPERIYALFGVSKKAYKSSLGALYKNRKIVLEPDGIRLAPADGVG